MKRVLITGGTTFVSRYAAEYYLKKEYEVYVLNRNRRAQSPGVKLIEADRHQLGNQLKDIHFDAILDITAYNALDIRDLLDSLGSFDDYILISSSAVYPEYEVQPFTEETSVAANRFWGSYGTDKIAAERALLSRVPHAYILRPPYLYGPLNNVYREAFVFECALNGRPFYIPGDGQMKLQFLHVHDLCRFMDNIMEQKPENHIFNVGNREAISIRDWVTLCYQTAGREVDFVSVEKSIEQRKYFSFYDYEYFLGVRKQNFLMPETIPLKEGLKEAFVWYLANMEKVNRKPYIHFIDQNLI